MKQEGTVVSNVRENAWARVDSEITAFQLQLRDKGLLSVV